jgi:cytochrome c5
VWKVIRQNCTECHGIDDYAFYALDKAAWQALIESKHKTAGIVLSDQDRNLLLDWLVSKFGPNTKPFPRTYVPPEITTFFSDPEAKRLLNRACTTCHPLDRVEASRFPEDRWRVLAVDMRERGAKLSDEELERLVEWLGRVWGTNQDK